VDGKSGRFAFPDVNLSVGNNRITGAVETTAAGPLTGTLTVDAPDLRTLAALALVQASGAGRASIEFTPDGEGQSLAVAFTGSGITYADVVTRAVEGKITVDDAFGTPRIGGNASASAVTIGNTRLDTVKATAAIEDGATRFEASAMGPDVDLSGTGRFDDGAVTIATLQGNAFDFPVELSGPATIRLNGPQSQIAAATLSVGGGSVRVDGAVAPQLDLTVVVAGVAASVANGFSPGLGAEGSVSGRATITGQPASPAFDWQVDWTGFRVAAARDAGLPALTVNASGKGTASETSLTATLSGVGISLKIDGQIPFSGQGLDLRADGTAPLALLALRSDRELRLAGNARVNLAITGSLAAPATNGTIDLVDATMADGETGFGISGANGRIDFDGRRATIQQVSGRFAQGGEIVVAGSIAVDQAGLPADLTVRVTDGRYSHGNVINTTFSGDLAIKGPLLGSGTVSGRIDLGRTEIQLPERLSGAATAIDVQHVNAPEDFVPPTPRSRPSGTGGGAPAGGGLALDIALSGNSGVFVRGFGIDAELGGTLRVAGTTGNPQAIGGLQMQRGRIEAFGRRFDFTRGVLTFAGSLVPVVDFSATTQTSDAVVTLNVTGPATNPQISFTSSSGLPQEEVLSRLLFNQSVGTLSAAQAIQLVDAVAQLTGGTGGGIVSRIREATGLDDLDIRQGTGGGTVVGVGKRLGDNVRLGVEAGTDSASGRVVIDLDITKNLKGSASAGQDGSGKVGLTYEREY
jgi:translocation and assembly module TamB